MYDHILRRMQECIRTRQYVLTLHAEEEMDNDNLSIFDIERGFSRDRLLSGKKTARLRNGNIW